MPQINRVKFRYEPFGGTLYLDSFRRFFHMERVEDVKETLQYLCFAFDVVPEIEGEIRFSTADDEPPKIRDLRWAPAVSRSGAPFPGDTVRLWSKN